MKTSSSSNRSISSKEARSRPSSIALLKLLRTGLSVSPLCGEASRASETDRLEARVDDNCGQVGDVDAQLGLLRLIRSLHSKTWGILLNSG